jgi:hypothetical protein
MAMSMPGETRSKILFSDVKKRATTAHVKVDMGAVRSSPLPSPRGV